MEWQDALYQGIPHESQARAGDMIPVTKGQGESSPGEKITPEEYTSQV
jgi:hypothetical protein